MKMGNTIHGDPFADPVIPLHKLPNQGDQLVLSDEVNKHLYHPGMRDEVHDHKGVVLVYASTDDYFGHYLIGVACGSSKQDFLLKPDGTPAWSAAERDTWPVFYWYHPEKEIGPEELKKLNTTPSATHCAKCGVLLRDPGYGPTYKHCIVCEP
jgi:hypothetical protein